MNLDELEKSWRQQSVTGQAVPTRELAIRFELDLTAARRRFTGMIVMAFGLLLLGWTVAIGAQVTGIKQLTGLEITAHLANSVFYLGWLGLAMRSKRAVRDEVEALSVTASESAAAALRVVELQVGNYRIAAWSLPLAVVINAGLAAAKFQQGELRGLAAATSAGFGLTLAAIVAVAMWRRYRKELKPRREELRRMLTEISDRETR